MIPDNHGAIVLLVTVNYGTHQYQLIIAKLNYNVLLMLWICMSILVELRDGVTLFKFNPITEGLNS